MPRRFVNRTLVKGARAAVFAAVSLLSIEAFTATLPPATPIKIFPATTTVTDVKRLALVIGNGAYRNVPKLNNTVNDATAIGTKLQSLGYEVYFATDVDRFNMNEAVGQFLLKVQPGMDTLLYYAGHGIELQGSNYLLPVDIPGLGPEQERLLRSEAINLTELLLDVEGRSARVSLVILDACRDNPFRVSGTRSLGAVRGLGRVDPPTGTFVIFSAGVGEQAVDNLGPNDKDLNGLFTRKLLRLMSIEGLELRTMVRQLRAEVREAALTMNRHSQVPSYYDQLLGDFFFKPKMSVSMTTCDMLVKPELGKDAILITDLEPGFRACEHAVSEYPNEPRFVHLLYDAQEQRTLQRALTSDRTALSEAYLALFPNGRFVREVRTHLTEISAKNPSSAAVARDSGEGTEKVVSEKADIAQAKALSEAARLEVAKAEAAKAAAAAEIAKAESAKAEAIRAAAQANAAKSEAARAEASRAEAQAELAKAEAQRAEALRVTAQIEAANAQSAKEQATVVARVAEGQKKVTVASTSAGSIDPNSSAVIPAIDPADIARLLQVHLKRLGCDPGTVDGEWTDGSRRALESFNKNVGTHLNTMLASLDALSVVRSKTARVCPLVCGLGLRVDGDRCVSITCNTGFYLAADGTCQKRKIAPKPVARQDTSSSSAPAGKAGGNCFIFNGKRFCE